MENHSGCRDYYRIEKAILFLKNNHHQNPGLKQTAEHLSLSEYHFERLFRRWAGISPKKFVQYLSREQTVKILDEADNVLDASIKLKLSGQSRLYDLVVNLEGVTPGQLKSRGEGLTIEYGIHFTTFGICQIAITKKGICSLIFLDEDEEYNIEHLRSKWKNARIVKNQVSTSKIVNLIFGNDRQKLNLHLKGTNFQIKVWEALLNIPPGKLTTYENVAKTINNPEGIRAVASAIANNPVSFLIPCHRVIKKNGIIHNYRWGEERKKAIIVWERANFGQVF